MKQATADLWRFPGADALCITTNGATRRSDGAAIMGRGVALQAKHLYPG